MLKIASEHLENILAVKKAEDLHFFLQKAIELEHSTIPPYLTALFSIMPGSNEECSKNIHSIVVEEMLHFNIACNILIALNGKPNIYNKDFIPNYPSVLPLNISNSLKVGLKRLSRTLVKDVFMEIEKPEKPRKFPVIERFSFKSKEFVTIGQFYRVIQQKIKEFTGEELPGDPALQVVKSFGPQQVFPILTKNDAVRAIDIIVDQGEGTTTTPFSGDDVAHYYRFNEIVVGKQLVPDNTVKEGFSYSGSPIILDETKIYPIKDDTKLEELPVGTAARKIAEEFSLCYSDILKALHGAFNGEPDRYPEAFELMFGLSEIASRVVTTPYPGPDNLTVGPTFEIIF